MVGMVEKNLTPADLLQRAMTNLNFADAYLRELAKVQNVRDPIEKHHSTTGKDFTQYADNVRDIRHRARNTFECAEEWKASEAKKAE